ncbi:hypothetical protein DH2020_044367 [Rehmannia glutinosa]|uniref:Protein kinase domain-containing protein n=1 Tax=Rehmannia glutinosa TaxID=99300 RepID=A0ABR0UHY1_REHGL
MASKECNNLFSFHLFVLFFLNYLCLTSQAFDNETDRLSLLSFKNYINDDPFQVLSSWNDSISFCQWKGVTCSSRRARVTMLALPSQKLGGTLSPAIANLTFLKVIDLRENNLRGRIPAEIGRLFRLEYIFLMQNNFGGEIPANLSQCSELQVINLNRNSLVGKIPNELSSLPKLIALHISANHSKLSRRDDSRRYWPLVNLEFLQVGNNNLSGNIPPSVFNLSKISIFALAFNNLVGSFPSSLGANMPNLKQLLVGVNLFSGNIPSSLSNISGLQIIDLPDNRLSGRVPDNLGRLTNLQRLNVGRNFLGGRVDFITSLTNCSRFQMLGLDSNQFSGLLPQTIANLSINMNNLQIGGNKLSGYIPSGITNLINLNILNVSWNEFDGPILPDIGKLFNLRQLFMDGNRFSGNIPFSIGNLTKLIELRLDGNQLESNIPSSLGNCQQLQILNLSGNNLSGIIPLEVFTLSSLTISLNLGRNSIPESLGRCSSLEHVFLQDFVFLRYLNLSFNDLKGEVPKNGVFANRSAVLLDGNNELCGGNVEFELPLCGFARDSVGRGKFYLKIIVGTITGVLGSVVISYVVFSCIRKRWRKKSSIMLPSLDWNSNFSYRELEKATNGFSEDNLVGKGSFASVYKGFIAEDEKYVAVKHRNLVKVLGCCSALDPEGRDFKAIVLEFMSNGSLDKWLHPNEKDRKKNLDIHQRLNVAIDVASALEYLHYYCRIPVAHCDLKPGNVLIDNDFCAHLSDFGLAKFLRKNAESQTSSIGIRGSVGYVAPEYGLGGPASISGDVYSFAYFFWRCLPEEDQPMTCFKKD